jgi:hypothetical protein
MSRGAIAKELGLAPWDLDRVAYHYLEETSTVLQARYDALYEVARVGKVTPEKVILPSY